MTKYRELEKRENKLIEPFLPKLKNYDNLFKILQNRFPQWTNIYAIKQNLSLIYIEDLERLEKSGFLEKQKFPIGKENGKIITENWFRLSPNGFNYLYNLNLQKLNKRIFWLTILMVIIGIIQIVIGIINIK